MKLLIAYDGSDCAKGAIRDLRRAGIPGDAQVSVLSVADLVLDVNAMAGEDFSHSPQMARTRLQVHSHAREALAESRQLAADGAKLLAPQFSSRQIQQDGVTTRPTPPSWRKRRLGTRISS
jgi:nucleotide-binding universal stress UspA family protein